MTDSEWVPEPRPVDPELTDGFEHATFPPPKVHWSTVADQLDSATFEQLKLMANGGTGEMNR